MHFNCIMYYGKIWPVHTLLRVSTPRNTFMHERSDSTDWLTGRTITLPLAAQAHTWDNNGWIPTLGLCCEMLSQPLCRTSRAGSMCQLTHMSHPVHVLETTFDKPSICCTTFTFKVTFALPSWYWHECEQTCSQPPQLCFLPNSLGVL